MLEERRRAFAGVTAYRAGEPYPYEVRDGSRTLHVNKTRVRAPIVPLLGDAVRFASAL